MNITLLSKSKIVVSLVFLFFLFAEMSASAQIFLPEGLNMPGAWDGWNNPPTNLAFASSSQVSGGRITKINTGTARWQTTFSVAASGADVTGGTYEWLFTSGSSGSPWNNKWGNITVSMNNLQTYSWSSSASNNYITVANGRWYTMNWRDQGYTNTQAIFMETSAAPVSITSVTQNPVLVTSADAVIISVSYSATPSAEEKFYVRYTTDGWSTSSLAAVSSETASIPAQPSSTKVEYYVFSTTITNPSAEFDMLTIRLNNNNGSNYSYVVGQTVSCGSAVVSTDPTFPKEGASLTLTFDASEGNAALKDYAYDVYIHTGVITNLSTSDADWKYTKADWGTNTTETKLTSNGNNLYSLTISDIRTYYGVPTGEQILKLVMVFRSDGIHPTSGSYIVHKNADNSDILVDVYTETLHVKLLNPSSSNTIIGSERIISVCAAAINHSNLAIYLDNNLILQTAAASLSELVSIQGLSAGIHWVKAVATSAKATVEQQYSIFIKGAVNVASLPAGTKPGINYIDAETVTLVLHDPPGYKQNVYVLGDFNDWSLTPSGQMHRTPSGMYYWITLTGLTSGEEYAYQYLIDGDIKIADPYCNKVLDPWNDPYISSTIYPNLKAYPTGKTTGIVSVLQTNQTPYDWEVTNFTNPDVRDLVIYELHLRDFTTEGTIAAAMQKLEYLQSLGVTAIELMPFNEFEGNDSWGYNPSFYFAPDKAYGTADDYKAFVDECHKRGIAVIQDMVLNHSFGQSPLVQMYFDATAGDYGKVTAQNPWYNVDAPNTSWSWGFDFNHESIYTKAFVDSVNAFWTSQYKIDGFRYDFTKGFTNTVGDGWDYDLSRINILKRIFNRLQVIRPDAYLILEHLTDNEEEKALANFGMLLWGNMNHQYNQATMGYSNNSDLSWGTHTARGFLYHNLISYMESHDEERLMYKNLQNGNSYNPLHDCKNLNIALSRTGLAAAFYLVTPGPKMIWQFGELGYDFGINHCPDGSYSSECRTSRKPIPWEAEYDYYNVAARKALYNRFAQLNRLKTNFPVFRTSNFNYSLDTYLKRMHLTTDDQKVTLIGNFDVVAQNIIPYFQQTGTWYEYFTGEIRNVTSTTDPINLQPGEYRLYSTSEFYNDYYAKATGNLNDLSSWGTNTDGSGSNPADFTTAHSNYYISNQANPTVSGDWTVSGTDSRVIIGNGTDAVNLSISGNMTVGFIQINKRSKLIINPTAAITINERLANDAGTDGLVIKSNATQTGSLIHDNSGLQATAERYISAWTDSNHGWHFVSSPVNNFALANSDFIVNPDDYDFYAWSETNNLWLNQKVTANNITSFEPGKGYLVSYQTAATKHITGALNVADVRISGLTHTTSSSSRGWHLLGNPFSSALNWTSGSWNKSSSIGGVPQIWDEATASYKTLTDGIIPANNGIMVFTSENGGSLTIPANARVHSSQNWYKAGTASTNQITLSAIDLIGNTAQQIIIRFLPEATTGFDLAFDSYFLPGYAPMFYSSTEGENLAVNSLPVNRNEISIPLAFVKNNASDFSIQLTEFPKGSRVFLQDLKTNITHPISQTPVYSFTSAPGDDADRFRLLFSLVNIPEQKTENIVLFTDNSHVFVEVPESRSGGIIEIFDIQGRLLLMGHVRPGSNRFISPAKGVVMVRVVAGGEVVNKKLIINH